MPAKGTVARGPAVLDPGALGSLLQLLVERAYRVIAPAIRDSAIAYQPIDSLDDLPAGHTAVQEPGSFRLAERPDAALFGYPPGPLSLKNFLHPPQVNLMTTGRENGKFLRNMGFSGHCPLTMYCCFPQLRIGAPAPCLVGTTS